MHTIESLRQGCPIWRQFFDFSRIPRPSKHEGKATEYLLSWAASHDLAAQSDNVGNVLISVPRTAGADPLSQPVILQAHIDMVCEKNAGVNHDFLRDPIPLYVDGGKIRSRGTTLGADDGIGVATALAIVEQGLQGKLEHTELHCLFTVDEETGLTGAENLGADFLRAGRLINLDSEDEGQIFIGCAGGCTTTATFAPTSEPTPGQSLGIEIALKGLQGGHSGGDIHLPRVNANILMAQTILKLQEEIGLRIANFNGGNLHNAIPREAYVLAAIPFAEKEKLRVEFNVILADILEKNSVNEPKIEFEFQTADAPAEVMTAELQHKLLTSIANCPNGVISMSADMPGLVETSTNLASVRTTADGIRIVTSQRSSSNSEKHDIQAAVQNNFASAGASVAVSDGYPGWQPDTSSALLAHAVGTYKKMFGTDPKVLAIHAGLECALFQNKKPGLDMISVGPTITDVHSPAEALDIESTHKFWQYVTELVR